MSIVELARLTDGMENKRAEQVSSKFRDLGDGRLQNARLEEVRAKQLEFRSKKAESGRLGGKRRVSNAKAMLEQHSSSLSPVSVQSPPIAGACEPGIEIDVQPPRGWPKTEAEVERMRGHIELTEALKCWLLARGRGWRDAKDVPIRCSFQYWLQVDDVFGKDRKEREKQHGSRSPSPKDTDRNEKTANAGKSDQYAGLGKMGGIPTEGQ